MGLKLFPVSSVSYQAVQDFLGSGRLIFFGGGSVYFGRIHLKIHILS